MQIITKGCISQIIQLIIGILFVIWIFYPDDLHRNNNEFFECLELVYKEDKEKLVIVMKDLSSLKTKYRAFHISAGKRYMVYSLVEDQRVDSLDFDIPSSVDDYFHNRAGDCFGGISYVKDSYLAIPNRYQTKGCESFHNARLVYCINGINDYLKSYPKCQKYLFVDKNQPIPENRCKLIRILDNNWLIVITD